MPIATALDDRQTRVFDALLGQSEKLSGMYRTAIEILAVSPSPGCEIARVSVICHCGRELMNGVPSVMSEIDIPRPDPSSDSLKNRLPELLKTVDLDIAQDLVPVPQSAAKTLSDLISAVAQEQGRNRKLASAVVTNGTDERHPAIRQWLEAQRYFAKWTHLDRTANSSRELPSDGALYANLRVVEDVIEARAGLFFENLHALEDILSGANTISGGGSA